MPQKYRTIFTEQWFKNHTRLKPNGVYEIRCSINKVAISGSSKDLDTAIKNFITALSRTEGKSKSKEQKVKRVLFLDFTEKWFEVVKKPTVKPITYESFLSVYRAHIRPYFKGKYIDELTAMQIQPLFSKLYKVGKTKAAINVHLLLNQIFKASIAERLITFNPMDGVTILKHHAKNGTALTYSEEKEFLRKLEKSKYKLTFALMLFCGMRRAELSSARIDENFVIVKNGKQRLSEIKTERKIPITPMLRRYLKDISKNNFKESIGYSCDLLSRSFKDLCHSHKLHSLRHTFITRCQ
ncbi:MAG: site-specific integrase [Clostridia bacterium]|nr:site-specific integrase [Clostridia bacterium]